MSIALQDAREVGQRATSALNKGKRPQA